MFWIWYDCIFFSSFFFIFFFLDFPSNLRETPWSNESKRFTYPKNDLAENTSQNIKISNLFLVSFKTKKNIFFKT